GPRDRALAVARARRRDRGRAAVRRLLRPARDAAAGGAGHPGGRRRPRQEPRRRGRPDPALCKGAPGLGLSLAPAAEDQPAEREAETEGAQREGPDRERLANRRQPLPAAERLLLLGRQRLTAPPLAQRAARPEAEIEVVEDLGGFFRHLSQCIACFGVANTAPPHLRPARRKRRGAGR